MKRQMSEGFDEAPSAVNGVTLPLNVICLILTLTVESRKDLLSALLVSKRVHSSLKADYQFWLHAASKCIGSMDEVFEEHDGNWIMEWSIQNHLLALNDTVLVAQQDTSSLRDLVSCHAIAELLDRHIFATDYFKDETNYSRGWGYAQTEVFSFLVPDEVSDLNDAFRRLAPNLNIFGDGEDEKSEFTGFTMAPATQDAFAALAQDLHNDEEEDEEELSGVDPFSDEEEEEEAPKEKSKTPNQLLAEFVKIPFSFSRELCYGSGNGDNCDDLVDVLYLKRGHAIAGIFISKNW